MPGKTAFTGHDILLQDLPGGNARLIARLWDCAELIEPVRRFFASWPLVITKCSTVSPLPAPVTVGREICRAASGSSCCQYTVSAPWLEEALREDTVTCLLNALSIELIMVVCRERKEFVQTHAAGLRLRGGACLIFGDNRKGKSTLTARLMAGGLVSYGDDLVGVTQGLELFSFGIAPRLRLPLPESETLRACVQKHTMETDGQYTYLNPVTTPTAPFGERHNLTSCLFLKRGHKGRAVVRRIIPDADEMVFHCVLHEGMARQALDTMRMLAEQLPCYELAYADLDEAATLLLAHSLDEAACLNGRSTDERSASGKTRAKHKRVPCGKALSAQTRVVLSEIPYRQTSGVSLSEDKAGACLVNHTQDAIFRLNGIGTVIWQMLAEPLSETGAADLLIEAFPEVSADDIRRDVRQLFTALTNAGLIEPGS